MLCEENIISQNPTCWRVFTAGRRPGIGLERQWSNAPQVLLEVANWASDFLSGDSQHGAETMIDG